VPAGARPPPPPFTRFSFAHALSSSVAGTVRGRVTTWAVPRRSHAEFSPRATRITRMLSFHPFCPTRSEGVTFLSLLKCAFSLILNFNHPTKCLIPKQQAALFAFIFFSATLLFFPRIALPATETGSCCSGGVGTRVAQVAAQGPRFLTRKMQGQPSRGQLQRRLQASFAFNFVMII
jgi:hypothetical protein